MRGLGYSLMDLLDSTQKASKDLNPTNQKPQGLKLSSGGEFFGLSDFLGVNSVVVTWNIHVGRFVPKWRRKPLVASGSPWTRPGPQVFLQTPQRLVHQRMPCFGGTEIFRNAGKHQILSG